MQQINVNKNVSIELTPDQLGVVIKCLDEGRHKIVYPILVSIENQVVQQMMSAEEAAILKKPEEEKEKV